MKERGERGRPFSNESSLEIKEQKGVIISTIFKPRIILHLIMFVFIPLNIYIYICMNMKHMWSCINASPPPLSLSLSLEA